MNRWARITGILCQGAVLGTLLFLAIMVLIAMHADTRLFRYQGF